MDLELTHVALHFSDKEKAETFFEKFLELEKLKEFSLPAELSEKIFGISSPVDIAVYGNEKLAIEVFFTEPPQKNYSHICITVLSIEDLKKRCEEFSVEFFTAEKEGRTLSFLKDFSGNLYELKEK